MSAQKNLEAVTPEESKDLRRAYIEMGHAVLGTPGGKGGWIAFTDEMPKPSYDPKNPGPTHGYILVTNNIDARESLGQDEPRLARVDGSYARPRGA